MNIKLGIDSDDNNHVMNITHIDDMVEIMVTDGKDAPDVCVRFEIDELEWEVVKNHIDFLIKEKRNRMKSNSI